MQEARDLGRGSWSVRYRLTTQDGRRIWVAESARVVKDGPGRFVVGTLAALSGVEALEGGSPERSAVFEAVFQAAGVGVAVCNAQRQVTMANEAFARMVGVEPGSLVGVPAATFCPPEAMEGLIAAAPVSGRHLEFRSRDGSVRPVEAELRPLGGGAPARRSSRSS